MSPDQIRRTDSPNGIIEHGSKYTIGYNTQQSLNKGLRQRPITADRIRQQNARKYKTMKFSEPLSWQKQRQFERLGKTQGVSFAMLNQGEDPKSLPNQPVWATRKNMNSKFNVTTQEYQTQ